MSKLPSIFHNSGKYITNNKKSFSSSINKEVKEQEKRDDFINYFNKRITVCLKNGNEITGVLLSKRNNLILLDTNDFIDIKDISCIK